MEINGSSPGGMAIVFYTAQYKESLYAGVRKLIYSPDFWIRAEGVLAIIHKSYMKLYFLA